MKITRVPLRVSLFGGGTDFPEFFQKMDGAVLSFSVKKYIYVASHSEFSGNIRLAYSQVENVKSIADIQHRLFRAVLEQCKVSQGIEIGTFADIPSLGSGLGSSSAFTVALLSNLKSYESNVIRQELLAEEAYFVERKLLKDPVGKQDHYGTAVGGIKTIHFHKNDEVKIQKFEETENVNDFISSCFKLIYTGKTRSALSILRIQQDKLINDRTSFSHFKEILELVELGQTALNRCDIFGISDALNKSWKIKKMITNEISSNDIDTMFRDLQKGGVLGGKLLGAGGGGFLLCVAEPDQWQKIRHENSKLKIIDLEIDHEGVTNFEI